MRRSYLDSESSDSTVKNRSLSAPLRGNTLFFVIFLMMQKQKCSIHVGYLASFGFLRVIMGESTK